MARAMRVLFFSLASPFGGSCRPQAADEGKVHHGIPSMGYLRKPVPHPASVGASATFPQGGRQSTIHSTSNLSPSISTHATASGSRMS